MPPMRPRAWLCFWTLATAACSASGADSDLPPSVEDGEGWGSRDISCETTADCASSEACIDNVCQMERCTDAPYDSDAPLGGRHTFFGDREIVTADANPEQGDYVLDGYHADESGLGPGGSWTFGGAAVVDLDGGDLLGTRPERLVAALEGSSELHVNGQDPPAPLDVGFQPIAVATADTDRDGIDEVAAFSADGRFALCRVAEGSCINRELQGAFAGEDVAGGDVDGDGYAEILFLSELDGVQHVVVWNPHYEETEETPRLRHELSEDFQLLDAGDLDGNGVSELVTYENADPIGVLSDKVHVYAWGGEAFVHAGAKKVGARALDVTATDLDRDRRAELIVLRSGSEAEIYRAGETLGTLSSSGSASLTASAAPRRIAASDIDGDSPSAALVSGPELVSGPMVPIIAMNFPPYLEDASEGTSIVAVGQTDKTSETYSDSVSLSLGVEFGVEAGIKGLFATSLLTDIERQVQHTRSTTTKKAVGTRFSIRARPEVHDESYGVVLLSSGCFHAYTYELDDPSGYLEDADELGDGGRFFGLMPVGGEHTVWSTVRYNSLAEALGTLPVIEVRTALGDPSTYPEEARRLDGSAVPAEDMVFPDPPNFAVSDIGRVGWRLTTSQSESQSEAMSHQISVSSSVNVGGLDIDGSVAKGFGESYSLSIGRDVLFMGKVPPILDDPDTEEDEYAEHKFSFSPFVYRQPYTAPDGSESSYYVMDFVVGE